ncbi:MAG: Uma2 family endonuclease [Longimonas sp.]|uniref:Uma2 family endonuclease n=1 Tax=Longimonas sp. TaxID=2039626 RepID=UPI0033583C39
MPVAASPVSDPTPLRFTVSDYHRMAEAGVLGTDRRIQLIDGHLFEMSPIGSRHAACVDRLNRLFVRAVDDRAIVRIQSPILLPPDSEPEPDVTLLKPRGDDYASRHPRSEDVLLVVEVADSSLTFDQEVKVPLYARAGIPEVWIVALDADRVYTYQHPSGNEYSTRHTYTIEASLPMPRATEAAPVSVSKILGS